MKYTALISVALLASASQAGFFTEVEDNNTLALANDMGIFSSPGGSLAIEGTIGQGDVDWFMFTLDNTASLSFFSVFGSNGGDGLMQIVAAGGDVIAFDDDSGVGLMPAIQLADLNAGTYYIGLSGFGDVDSGSVGSDELADGGQHTENFSYKLNVGFSVVPAPGATALFGMGGLLMTKRRR